jgi:hypothetical protein
MTIRSDTDRIQSGWPAKSKLGAEPGISVLKDMKDSGGSPRDLTNQQLDLLRLAFEDQDVGLFLFATQIFGYKDLTTDIHLPISRFLGKWGMSLTKKAGEIWEPPIEKHGDVIDSWRRLMVCIPRECFKTSLCTRALSLLTLAKNPDATIGIFNEKEENAQSWVAAIAEVVESSILFQLLWRDMIPQGIGFWDRENGVGKPRGLKWGATGIKFERPTIGVPELSIEPRGIGGAVTGKHYTHKILDDIIGEKTADSTALMQDAINWIDHSRPLERPAENGCELVVHTPWAYADVYAHMINKWKDEYKVHKRHLLEDDNGLPSLEGHSIFPQKISTRKAKQMHKTDPFVFWAQYQCVPKAGRTLDFADEWFRFGQIVYSGREPVFAIDQKYYDPEIYDLEAPVPSEGPPRLIPLSWMEKAVIFDPVPGKEAERKKETYCRHGLAIVGKDPWSRRFCLESERSDVNETDICHRILELCQKWNADKIGIEAINAFHLYGPLITLLSEKHWDSYLPDLMYLEPEGRQKEQRIRQDLAPAHQNGFWYYNREGTSEAVQELTEFPHSTYKDVSDAQSYTDKVCHRPTTPDEARESWYIERVQEQSRGQTGYGEFF